YWSSDVCFPIYFFFLFHHIWGGCMRRSYEKIIFLEHISLTVAIVIGFIALVKSFYILVYLSFYILSLSIACNAIFFWNTYRKTNAIKQLLREAILLLLTTYLLIIL